MSPEPDFELPDINDLTRGRFTYLPVAPGRLEFALEVRRRILETRPPVVAGGTTRLAGAGLPSRH